MSDSPAPQPTPPPSNSTWFGVWILIVGALVTVGAAGIIWGIGGALFSAGLFICAAGGALITKEPK